MLILVAMPLIALESAVYMASIWLVIPTTVALGCGRAYLTLYSLISL